MVLTRRERELADERMSWRVKNAETRARLTKARVVSHIHPYLNHSALIPDQYHPETMRTGGVTLATAIEDTCQGLAGPWCAQHEREAVVCKSQWFKGSRVQMRAQAQARQKTRGKQWIARNR